MIALPILFALACIEPAGPKITAGDLAPVVPAFAAVPASTTLSYSPRPGAVRRFTAAELGRWLPGSGTSPELPESVCVEWSMKKPYPERFEAAMRAELPEGSQLAILETSQAPVPPGEVRFPRAGLHGPVWRGFVEYGNGAGRFDVWARVDVRIPSVRVIATRDIPAGTVIEPEMVRLDTLSAQPEANGFVSSVEEAVGRAVRRRVAEGTAIPGNALERRFDVRKGDVVQVNVRAGSASIGVQGVALAAAAAGEMVSVRVPDTNRTMKVRVAGPGQASLLVGGGN